MNNIITHYRKPRKAKNLYQKSFLTLSINTYLYNLDTFKEGDIFAQQDFLDSLVDSYYKGSLGYPNPYIKPYYWVPTTESKRVLFRHPLVKDIMNFKILLTSHDIWLEFDPDEIYVKNTNERHVITSKSHNCRDKFDQLRHSHPNKYSNNKLVSKFEIEATDLFPAYVVTLL